MDTQDRSGTSFLDEDIDFDFFDADEAEVRADERRRPARREQRYRPRRVRRQPNWSRLAVAVSIIAVCAVVAAMIVGAWRDHRKQVAFEGYFGDVATVIKGSNTQGSTLVDLLQQPGGVERAVVVERLDGLVAESEALIEDAEKIEVPKQLRETHSWLVTTLRYRNNGFTQLRTVFLPALDNANVRKGAEMVAEANWRLLAADIIYADSYVANATKVMKRDGVSGVSVPVSVLAASDPEFASVKNAQLTLDRFRQSGKAGRAKKKGPVTGLHGTNLAAVTIQPAGVELQPGTTTEVDGQTDLAFEVAIENGGDGQEVSIPVTIDITGTASEPQQLKGTLEVIDPNEVAAVKIPVEDIPPFGEVLDVKVTVGKVPGEENLDNNSLTYQVLFSLT